jgi:hypothetical protein
MSGLANVLDLSRNPQAGVLVRDGGFDRRQYFNYGWQFLYIQRLVAPSA